MFIKLYKFVVHKSNKKIKFQLSNNSSNVCISIFEVRSLILPFHIFKIYACDFVFRKIDPLLFRGLKN